MKTPKIIDLVRNNKVSFSYYRKGMMYYSVSLDGLEYLFPVPLDDIGDATLFKEDKAILFMRYIRKAQNQGELVQV
jgi:hypothetical protein